MRSAAAIAPEIAAAARQVESRRRANQALLVAFFREKGVLRGDLDADQATDIIWALTSYDMYRALVNEQHWPADQYQDWLAATLVESILNR
jgi:hypothetical protein